MTDLLRQLQAFQEVSRGLLTDVRTAHHVRGQGASSAMKEDDRDFYTRLCGLFGENHLLLKNYEGLYSVQRPSHVDALATELSIRTGNQWEVKRVKHIPDVLHPERTTTRYVVKVTVKHGGEPFDHHFFLHRPQKNGAVSYILAMILDMVIMGSIP